MQIARRGTRLDKLMLTVQYRMHPEIRSFASMRFYEARPKRETNKQTKASERWRSTFRYRLPSTNEN